MDDTAQSPAQPVQQTPVQPVPPQQSSQSVPPVQEPAVAQPAQQQPVNVPSGGKEQEAAVVAEVQPTQPEIVVPQEVKEVGVEATPSEEPELTQEHKEVGMEAVKEAAPVPSGPKVVQLPEDYKAPKGFFPLMNQKVKNAATWLYFLLFKAEQQAAKKALEEKKNV